MNETWSQYRFSPSFDALLGYISAPLLLGSLAVNLFFVISGYCIHRRGASQLASNANAHINLFQFFTRRAWRIYPTYVAALILTASIDALLMSSQLLDGLSPQSHSLSTFVMSLLSLQGIAAPYFGSNGVFWTLSVEIHLYIVYSLLFYISQKHSALKALGLAFLVSLVYMLVDESIGITDVLPYRGGFNPIFLPYWFMWTFGFYIAEVEAGRAVLPRRTQVIAGFFGVLTLCAYAIKLSYVVNISSAFLFGSLLRWSITEKGNQFWDFKLGRLLAEIGTFSYSLYAAHIPLLLLFRYLLAPEGGAFSTFYPVVLISLIVIFTSWILFFFGEMDDTTHIYSKCPVIV